MGDFFPDTPTAGFAFGKGKIDGIAAFCFLISCFGSTLDGHSLFAGIAGAEIYAVPVLRIQAKGGLAARFEAAAVLPFLFPVRGENGTAAIKNAGAFAPVAHADFVIACNQAFGIILFPNFRVVSF